MNIITGYLASTTGDVFVDEYNILDEPDLARKSIGYLPEQPPVYFDMTVMEYLEFAAELKKIPKNKRKQEIDEIMEMVKITDMSRRLIKNLSKGYRQRVGLAQAILGYPEVIILDEPTVGLDPKQIIEIRDLIKSLKEKHTVILSSHILSEVSAVCDYILIISHGKLVASGTPDQLGEMALGSNTLEITVRGNREEIESVITEIENIKEYHIEECEEENNAVKITIETKEGLDVRENVFYKMAGIHCPIIQMQMNRLSLENIFLELTEDSDEDGSGEEVQEEEEQTEMKEEEEDHAGHL